MTYKDLERMFIQTDWSDPESVRQYQEAAEKYRKEQDEGGTGNGHHKRDDRV